MTSDTLDQKCDNLLYWAQNVLLPCTLSDICTDTCIDHKVPTLSMSLTILDKESSLTRSVTLLIIQMACNEFLLEIKAEDEFPVEIKPKVAPRSPPALSCFCKICGAPAPSHFHFGGEFLSFSKAISMLIFVTVLHIKCSAQCCFSCRAFFRRSTERKNLRGWLRYFSICLKASWIKNPT